MEETILETFNDVKFIQGATKMNQTNWQAYFGTALPNGIYDGLMVQDYYGEATFTYPKVLTDGSAFVNGLIAQIQTEDGYTEIGEWTYDQEVFLAGNALDRFICLRVYLQEEKAQIVQKTGFVTEYGPTQNVTIYTDYDVKTMAMLKNFLADESYGCTRNEYIWDIPIFYQTPNHGAFCLCKGRSLRRPVKLFDDCVQNPNITGCNGINSNGICLVSGTDRYLISTMISDSSQQLATARIYADSIDLPKCAVVAVAPNGNADYTKKITLVDVNWYNNLAKADNFIIWHDGGITFKFADPEAWDHNGHIHEYTMPNNIDLVYLRFTWMATALRTYVYVEVL